MHPTRDQLKHHISQFIQGSSHTPDHYNQLALSAYHYQLTHNQPYAHYLRATLQGQDPTTISHYSDIPALPTDAFKLQPNPTSLLHSQRQTTFLTSGTTTDRRGAHHFADTELYESSILAAWQHAHLPPLHPTTFILTPSPKEAPHSSLSHMMETLRLTHCPQAHYLMHRDRLELDPLLQSIHDHPDRPITLLATALATLHLMDQLTQPISLPPGSWLMETGGYKGTAHTLTKPELYHRITTELGIPAQQIINEYSMTELSSQAYTRGLDHPHQTPPWLLTQVVDPETLEPVATGEIGHLHLYDLANLDSVLAIRTQDLAISHDPHHFTLIGRDPSALPRGCSRAADYALSQPSH